MILCTRGCRVAALATAINLNGAAALGGAFRESALHPFSLKQRVLTALSRSGAVHQCLGIARGLAQRVDRQRAGFLSAVAVGGACTELQMDQSPLRHRTREMRTWRREHLAWPRAGELSQLVGKDLAGAA